MSREDLADILPSPKKETRGFSRTWGIAHGIAWGLLFVLLSFGVPRVEAIFKDFGIGLPGVTVLVIRASHLVVRLFYVLAPLLVILLGTVWFLLDALTKQGEVRSARAWSVLVFVSPLLLIVLSLVALVLPFSGMHNRLSG